MHKGPGTRTSRTQAEKMGVERSGFDGGVDMEGDAARAGHPSMPGLPVDPYKEQAPSIASTNMPSDHETPFVLGK
jgi:hypothetical protein